MKFLRALLLIVCVTYTRSRSRSIQWIRQVTSATLISIMPFSPAFAAIDCNNDCYSNCARVAPGSEAYCKTTCIEYCDQPDRQDGLSGSKDASKGETGMFGGSIDGTVTRGNDRPPTLMGLIPDDMMKSLQLKVKPQEPRKGIYFKDFLN